MPKTRKTAKRNSRPLNKRSSASRTARLKTAAKRGKKGAAPVRRKSNTKMARSAKKSVRRRRSPLLKAYQQALTARLLDQRLLELCERGQCAFHASSAGHEVIQTAAAMIFRPGTDWSYPYYRDMAFTAAAGVSPADIFASALGKETRGAQGRRRQLSLGSRALHIVTADASPTTRFTQAAGAAIACRLADPGAVVLVSSGEGACSSGDFYEALNWATRERLPIVFLVQNNGYSKTVAAANELPGGSAAAFAGMFESLETIRVDGCDFEQSLRALKKAHERARKGKGPSLVEASVPRLQGHTVYDDQSSYRSQAELKKESRRDPIAAFKKLVLRKKAGTRSELNRIEREVNEELEKALSSALEQPEPEASPALAQVYAGSAASPEDQSEGEREAKGDFVFREAIKRALSEEMRHNHRSLIIGHDVRESGAAGVTNGLEGRYGSARVLDGPLDGNALAGAAAGAAVLGCKAVVELPGAAAFWQAFAQVEEAASMSFRSQGEFDCGLLARVIVGLPELPGDVRVPSAPAHLPGAVVVYPSNAADAKGLLKSAMRSPDPVVFIEHAGLYEAPEARGALPGDKACVPLGKAAVARYGTDVTVVTWGPLVFTCLSAAARLAEEGCSCEVIDLRTLSPLDAETVFDSVRKTSKVLIAHEETKFMGMGAEIAAQLAENCFEHLDAPLRRVAAKPVPFLPCSQALVRQFAPQEQEIIAALRSLAAY